MRGGSGREPPLTARTRTFAVLGDPVDHSLSPLMHNAALASVGADAVYIALRCTAGDVVPVMRALARTGGGNVTVPHKLAAARALDVTTEAVEATGACNTFWGSDGRLCGDNTDVEGFGRAAAALGVAVVGKRVLLLGAGGAAAAALYALLRGGADEVRVWNRTPERASELAARFDAGREAPGRRDAGQRDADQRDADQPRVARAQRADLGGEFDLIVNATPLGLRDDDPPPLDLDVPARVGAVLDLTYALADTRWVRDARSRGIPAADGKEMLIAQGAAAFERWLSQPAPVDVMRQAIAAVRGA